MTVTIIGGPHDGQRINCPYDTPCIYLAVYPKVVYEGKETLADAPFIETYRYVTFRLRYQDINFNLYRYEKMSDLAAMFTLVEGYRQSPTEQKEV